MAEAGQADRGEIDETEAMLRSATVAFEIARDALERRARGLLDGEENGRGADLSGPLKEMGRALTVAVEQARRVSEQREKADGGGGLDLDAARVEVRRRLDRMRGRGDAEPVPGGAE
jgi:hypothetical protein